MKTIKTLILGLVAVTSFSFSTQAQTKKANENSLLWENSRRKNQESNNDIDKLREYHREQRCELPFLGISMLFIQTSSNNLNSLQFGQEIFDDKPKTGIVKYVVTPQHYWQYAV